MLRAWAVKEACLKGTRRGVTGVANRLTVEFGMNGPLPIGNWRFSLHWPDSTHVAAAAVRKHQNTSRTVSSLAEGH